MVKKSINEGFSAKWNYDKINNCAKITTGSRNTQDKTNDGEFPFFVRSQKVEHINSYSNDEEAVLTAGDGDIGKIFHYINGKFDFHQRVYKISNFDERLDGYFFYIYFSKYFLKRVMSMTAKSTVNSIRMDMISEMLIPLPKIDEQHKITKIISDIEELIKQLDFLIIKKKNIKKGTTQELLTGKRRLEGFQGEWKNSKLQKFVKNFIVPMRNKPKKFSGNTPWCRIEDFDGKYLSNSKSRQYVDKKTIEQMNLKVYPINTVLVSCSADLGKCAIIKKPLVSNQTFIGLVVDESIMSNEFLYYYMTFKAGELNNLSSGTTISYLSREQFEFFNVVVPPTKDEQTLIAQIISDMDSEIQKLETCRNKYIMIKNGMMQKLFTGEIRLT